MVNLTLNTTVSAIALMMTLSAARIQASYSVGKEEDRDKNSLSIPAFTDINRLTKKESLYEEEAPDENASQSSGFGAIEIRGQKLTDIKEFKKYIFKGNLEITPNTYEALSKFSTFYEIAFKTHDRGLFIKEWKASLGFEPLIGLLHTFKKVRIFKVNILWDKEADALEMLIRAIQFYEDLAELDISNCKLTESELTDIVKSIKNPEKLRSLDITGNKLSTQTLKHIKERFQNLVILKSDQEVGIIPLTSIILAPKKPLPRTPLAANTATPIKKPLPVLPTKAPMLAAVDLEEQGLPSDVLKKAKAGDPAAQTEIAILYEKGENVAKNAAKAIEWFRKAAAQNHTAAQVYLGWMHLEGHGVSQDDHRALEWFKMALSRGDTGAQKWIDLMHQNGRGFSQKTAEQGEKRKTIPSSLISFSLRSSSLSDVIPLRP